MNFVDAFKKGKEGKNLGMSTGIHKLNIAINGLQKKQSITIAAAPKIGKTTLVDYICVLSPYLLSTNLDNIQWIYYSYEIDRVSKEYKFASFFFYHDYQLSDFIHTDGIKYEISSEYLLGKIRDRNGEFIQVSEEHEEILKKIYINRIIPLFGEYNSDGYQVKPGKIIFIDEPDNPTGMYKYLKEFAKRNGEYKTQRYTDNEGNIKTKIVGYKENNEELQTIVVVDHIRKCRTERGYTIKQTMDKWSEYTNELRNKLYYTIINVVHSNRNLANVDRLKLAGEFIFPTSDDIKDSGNLAEDATVTMTLFNPADEKYNLIKHFGKVLKEYPGYRSLHITESRDTKCPVHIQLQMLGQNVFKEIT